MSRVSVTEVQQNSLALSFLIQGLSLEARRAIVQLAMWDNGSILFAFSCSHVQRFFGSDITTRAGHVPKYHFSIRNMHRVTATIMVSDHRVATDRDIWPYSWRSHGHPTNRRTRGMDAVNAR